MGQMQMAMEAALGCAPVHTFHTAAIEASLSEGTSMGGKPTESIVSPKDLGIKNTENDK